MSAVEVCHLRSTLGKTEVLKDVSFTVSKGEVFGYLGPNGAGKTTTVRTLVGLLAPTSGSVKVFGKAVQEQDAAFKSRFGVAFENAAIYDDLSVDENLMFHARVYGVENPRERIDELLSWLHLAHRRNEFGGRLSKGMKQKVAISRLLLHDPELMFFDEPTIGLDPTYQQELLQLIHDLADQGKTVFLCSHNLHEVGQVCSRVAFLKEGRLIAVEPLDALLRRFQDHKAEVHFKTRHDREEGNKVLKTLGQTRVLSSNNRVDIMLREPSDVARLDELLGSNGIAAESIIQSSADLYDIFNAMVSN